EEVESVCRETRVYLDKNEFDQALKTVELNLKTLTGEPRLMELRKTVIAARRDFERERPRKRMTSVAQAVTDEVPIAPPTREAEMAEVVAQVGLTRPRSQTVDGRKPIPASRTGSPPWRKWSIAGAGCGVALAAGLLGVHTMRSGASATVLEVQTLPR